MTRRHHNSQELKVRRANFGLWNGKKGSVQPLKRLSRDNNAVFFCDRLNALVDLGNISAMPAALKGFHHRGIKLLSGLRKDLLKRFLRG